MISSEVARRIKAIKQDKEHGAAWLSQQALITLILATEKSQAKTTSQFLEELKEIARTLSEVRPSMASIANYSSQFLYEIITYSQPAPDLKSLKAFARAKGKEIIKSSQQTRLKVTNLGARLIQPSDIVMTCSYSSTVCHTLQIAKQKGKIFQVIVAQSKSPQGTLYGKLTVEELAKQAISSELIEDDNIEKYIHQATKVLVGADSILCDGAIINGTPTYTLALAATKAHIPFYSLCEIAKLDIQSYQDKSPKLEPGFDKIPPQLITGIITELDMIKPEEIRDYIREKSKWWRVVYS